MAKLKYNEETKIVSFRIPVSKIPIIRKLVNDELLDIKKEIQRPEFPEDRKDYTQFRKNDCDCKLDESGLLRRGKRKCTKTKKEHKF